MSSSEHAGHGHGHAHGGAHPWYHAHHFDRLDTQVAAIRLGMWLFLATEVLLFAGLFLGYTLYRWLYFPTFHAASHLLDVKLGAFNTIVLITSSLSVALAYDAIKKDQAKKCVALLAFTLVCAAVFLVVKYFEYSHKFHEGQLPGRWYTYEGLQAPGVNLYFTIYFLTTGLHAFHVIVGMTVLAWVMVRVMKGKYSSAYYVPVELGGLYWHLVDLIWIFLFPLLYLV
jgi:cytochrome c oxidase subunit III